MSLVFSHRSAVVGGCSSGTPNTVLLCRVFQGTGALLVVCQHVSSFLLCQQIVTFAQCITPDPCSNMSRVKVTGPVPRRAPVPLTQAWACRPVSPAVPGFGAMRQEGSWWGGGGRGRVGFWEERFPLTQEGASKEEDSLFLLLAWHLAEDVTAFHGLRHRWRVRGSRGGGASTGQVGAPCCETVNHYC